MNIYKGIFEQSTLVKHITSIRNIIKKLKEFQETSFYAVILRIVGIKSHV